MNFQLLINLRKLENKEDKIKINDIVNSFDIVKKNKLISGFLKNKIISQNLNIKNIFINLYEKYIICKKDLFSHNLNKTTVIIFDLKKKQLYSTVMVNGFVEKFLTNGIILKKMMTTEKNKKKDTTISGYNIKKIIENTEKNLLTHIKGCKNNLLKILKLIRKNMKGRFCLYVLSPKINFFKNKFKKAKSIKRKLRKKYVLI